MGVTRYDTGELEIIEREAREGNEQARAILAGTADAPPPHIETRDERRKRLTMEHHLRIVAGEIPIGPLTVHTGVQEDIRDNRDPSVLGEEMLAEVDIYRGKYPGHEQDPIVEALRGLDFCYVADYDPGESRVTFTARAYRKELEDRADKGDKFAISVLETGEPGDSGE